MRTGVLLVRSNKAASVSIDGKGTGDLAAGGFLKVSAVAGEHFIEAREEGGACKWEKKVTIPAGMQVAEDVDFAAACPLKPDSTSPAPGQVSAALPKMVDSKVQEAQKQFDRGCLMLALRRFKDAIPLLEAAAAAGPLPSLEGCADAYLGIDSLDAARGAMEKAKIAYRDCPSQLSSGGTWVCASGHGYEAGEYQAFIEAETRFIQGAEEWATTLPPAAADRYVTTMKRNERVQYRVRGLGWFALGNPMAALRDLQASMDLCKKYPEAYEWENYFYRAVVYSDIGNPQEAVDDCRVVLTFKIENLNGGPYAQKYCTKLIADNQSSASPSPIIRAATSVDDAIRRIRGGRYSPMPQAQASGGSGSGSPRLSIENATQYVLQVYLSGPETRSVSIPAGGSSVIDLQTGAFKLAAEIPNSSILPFYGEQTFSSGTAYVEKFYIQRVQ
jgi:tetratricopeptide (TPR) repeat protein